MHVLTERDVVRDTVDSRYKDHWYNKLSLQQGNFEGSLITDSSVLSVLFL